MLVSDKARETLLAIKDFTFEPATWWYQYIVPIIPREIWIINKTRLIIKLFTDEVLAVTKLKPIRVTPSRHADLNATHNTWVVSLPNKVRAGFTLFNFALTRLSE